MRTIILRMPPKSAKKTPQNTWSHRFAARRYPKRVTLDADFAGIPAGSTLFVGTPTGKSVEEVTPFWRVIEPGSAIAKKLRVAETWLRDQRQAEARE